MKMSRFGTVIGAMLVLCASSTAPAASLITELGALGDASSGAIDINENGVVVGAAEAKSVKRSHAFRWVATKPIEDLGTLGGDFSGAFAINKHGDIVGLAEPKGLKPHAFVLFPGTPMKDLGMIGKGRNSIATAINDHADIVGETELSDGSRHAFFYPATGEMRDLGTLGGSSSYACDISNRGVIVGRSRLPLPGGGSRSAGPDHAFLYVGSGPMQDLGTLGGTDSCAMRVNDNGTIVGYSQMIGDVAKHAFRYDGTGLLRDLGTLGGRDSDAIGINDADVVVGSSKLKDEKTVHATLWLPSLAIVDLDAWLDRTDPSAAARWELSQASQINNAAQVVGVGRYDVDGDGKLDVYRAFIMEVSALVQPKSK